MPFGIIYIVIKHLLSVKATKLHYIDSIGCKMQDRSVLFASRYRRHTGGSEHLFSVILAFINYIDLFDQK